MKISKTILSLATLAIVSSVSLIMPAQAVEPAPIVSGWFGYWTSAEDMVEVAKKSENGLGETNIFWWKYAGAENPVCTTTLACPNMTQTPYASAELLASAKGLKEQGVEVYATHTDLDYKMAGSLSAFLATSQNRRIIANRLTRWAIKSGVDGVDLDWENFAFNDGSDSWETTRPRLTKTIRLLGKKLHAVNLKLSVTVPGGYAPFREDGSPNPGGGYSVYDWAAIAPHVDRLPIMTYDYSWSRPGPIGPHWWVRQVAKSAALQMGEANRHKIFLGVHQYGKAWYARDAEDDYITVGDCDDRWKPTGKDGLGLSISEARSLTLLPAVHGGDSPNTRGALREW